MAPITELEKPVVEPPKVNPVFFGFVALTYRTYLHLPGRIRLQINLALAELRNREVAPVKSRRTEEGHLLIRILMGGCGVNWSPRSSFTIVKTRLVA